jgi:hypothetical protein
MNRAKSNKNFCSIASLNEISLYLVPKNLDNVVVLEESTKKETPCGVIASYSCRV